VTARGSHVNNQSRVAPWGYDQRRTQIPSEPRRGRRRSSLRTQACGLLVHRHLGTSSAHRARAGREPYHGRAWQTAFMGGRYVARTRKRP